MAFASTRLALAAALLGLASLASATRAAAVQPRDTAPDTWEATDGLGRALPTHADVGDPSGRLVFVFYYIWHQRSAEPEPYDISRIIAGKVQPWSDAAWGPSPAFHWWSQPALGYYDINDDFVIRRHAQMLADAGVDAIVMDVTNAFTYDPTWQKLCDTYQSLRDAGNRTPNIAFIAHASTDATVQHLYDQLYASQRCAGLWQRWLGKPLMLAAPGDGLSQAARDFFTFRESWAWTDPSGWFGNGEDKWPWLDNFPQNFGWHGDHSVPEEMPVGVAQHPVNDYGRSHHAGSEPPLDASYVTADTAKGLGFQEQWETAISKKPSIAFVTQWNEWIAQRFVTCGAADTGATQFLGKPLACGDTHFIDEFDPEFSRDVEPMQGGFGDAYYYQLASNVRRFKGARAVRPASAPKRMVPGDFRAFDDVMPAYLDDLGDVTHRDSLGYAGPVRYVNTSGRNDIVLARVARDAASLSFYVQTAAPLSPATDAAWMTLWLDTDGDASTGFLGFDYVVNRTRNGTSAAVEQYDHATSSWTHVGNATLAEAGSELMLAVPRGLVHLVASAGQLSFRFKWSDDLPPLPKAADFIDQGDVAPNGRFTYRYIAVEDSPESVIAGGAAGTAGNANGSENPGIAAGAGGAMAGAGAGVGGAAGRGTADGSGGGSGAGRSTYTTSAAESGCGCTLPPRAPSSPFGAVIALALVIALQRRATRACARQ